MEFLADSVGLLDYHSSQQPLFTKDTRESCYDVDEKSEKSFEDQESVLSKYVVEKHCPKNGSIFTGRVDALTGELLHGYCLYVEQQEAYEGAFNRTGERHGPGAVCTKLDGSGKFLGSYRNDGFYHGTYVTSKFTYTGSFGKKSMFEGEGTLVHEDGTVYEGSFYDGVYHGRGRLNETNNHVFEGDFVRGEKHGNGKLAYQLVTGDQYRYSGDWKHNMMEGNGTEINEAEQTSYVGEFRDSLRHGLGTLKCAYLEMTGPWYNGRPVDGRGWTLLYPKKNIIYVGEAMGCRPHGDGTMVYRLDNGTTKIYEGSFRCGLRHGTGRIASDGECEYAGEWRGDEPIANLNEVREVAHASVQNTDSTNLLLAMMEPKEDKPSRGSASVPDLLDLLESSCSDLSDIDHLNISVESSASNKTTESTHLNYKGAKSVGNDEWVYDNGDTFSGHIDAFQNRHGFGIFTQTRTGTVYSGEWNMSRRNGKGNQTNPQTGVQYTGDFVANMVEGRGRLTLTDGSQYRGEFRDGIMHGIGKFVDCISGSIYVGTFVQGEKHGQGEETYQDDTLYKGEFCNGKRCGEGLLYNVSEEAKTLVYKGLWNDDRMTGDGERFDITDPCIGRFKGEFIDGKRNGHGSFHTHDGRIYEGPWSNNKPQDGDWVISRPEGSVYYGAANCDPQRDEGLPLPMGFGTQKDGHGDFYTGSFVDGVRDGSGLCVFSGGEQWDGKWENGIFVKYNRARP